MKKKFKEFFCIIIVILLVNSINQRVLARHLDVEGWELLDSKKKIVFWQKKEKEFTAEVLINMSVPLGSEILKGYIIKTGDKIISDYFSNTYPFGIWKVIYNGFDNSGNIYLKVIREKGEINNNDSSKIIEEIVKVSSSSIERENIIEERLEIFSSILDDYMEKEGNLITVDPSKIIIISDLNNVPPFLIEVNDKHSVINIAVVSLD